MKSRLMLLVMSVIMLSGCSREYDEKLLIAFDDTNNIFIMNDDGSDIRQMTTIATSINPSFSPDGKTLVYWRTGTLYTMNIEEKQERFLHGATLQFSTWSPDGTKIAFFDSSSRLSTINPDGTNYTVLNVATTFTGPISWSADSSVIACRDSASGFLNYFYLSNPSSPQLIIPNTNILYGFSFSPSGEEAAYIGVSTNLYISKTDLSSSGIIQSGPIVNPSWSPDGKTLVYEYNGEIRKISSIGGTPQMIAGGPGLHNPCYRYKPR